jgi:hypothetical protein
MKFRQTIYSPLMPLAILQAAAWIVPVHQRMDWVAEWRAELWHVCNGRDRRWSHGEQQATAFCLGAFKDAFWVRRNLVNGDDPNRMLSSMFQFDSPTRCVLFLAGLAGASMILACCLPGVRKAILPSPYPDPQTLVLISPGGHISEPSPAIPLADYRSWRSNTQRLFTGIAFYQPALKRVDIGRHRKAEMSVAVASDNLFEVLQVSDELSISNPTNQEHLEKLILSRGAWQKYFRGDPRIVGRTLLVAGQRAIVAGVIADGSWRLPDQMDAWLLEDAHSLTELPAYAKGYVVADVRASDFPPPQNGQWQMSVPGPHGSSVNYDCVSLAERGKQPMFCFLFALVLACATLPATTSLPLGEYSESRNHQNAGTKTRRWGFLAAKIALLLVIVAFVSIDLAHLTRSINSLWAEYIQLGTSLCAFHVAFRWALHDQRKRCPECLRLLTNPAYVGQSSRNFLAWNGTELICVGGHGLLHIPDMPTSWFSTQRWLYLDPSWSSLFSDAYLGTL